MGVGNITPGTTMQINSVEMSTLTNQNNKEVMIQTANQSVTEKMKIGSAYQPTISEKTIIKAIEEANKKIEGGPREFEFSIHEKTKQIMVKVVNTDTKEVIREIPPEKILDMVVAMCEQAGLFLDEKK